MPIFIIKSEVDGGYNSEMQATPTAAAILPVFVITRIISLF
jgi:hypothetical protein